MAQTLAIANMKGGVGKTTTSVLLSQVFAGHHTLRVLLIDLDAQSNASFALMGRARYRELEREGTPRAMHAANFFEGLVGVHKKTLRDYVVKNAANLMPDKKDDAPIVLDLVWGSRHLRTRERFILQRLGQIGTRIEDIQEKIGDWFNDQLDQIDDDYDLIIFDCPPGMSIFADAALRNADAVLTPTMPEFLPSLGVRTFMADVREFAGASRNDHCDRILLFNLVKPGNPEHNEEIEDMRALAAQGEFDFVLAPTTLPNRGGYPKMLADSNKEKPRKLGQRFPKNSIEFQRLNDVAIFLETKLGLRGDTAP